VTRNPSNMDIRSLYDKNVTMLREIMVMQTTNST
jgi:hypothetical protein